MALQDEINKRIKEEIETDPMSIGYAGKTDEEIKVLLNNSVIKQRIVEEPHPSPMNRIMAGLAGTQNIITAQEVTDAKKVII
jgi:hypothetical protein